MKKYGIYLMMTVTLFAATSCGDDDVDHLNDWMIANQQAFNAIRTNPEYREIKSPGNEGSIYYKVLQKGEGTDSIYYTSWISCYYEGRFVADYPRENILNGDIFERRLYEDGIPASFTVGGANTGVISGWKTALYGMVKGDKWEIWIPYQLAYGRTGSSSSSGSITIPGYSTLVFEIEITGVDGK